MDDETPTEEKHLFVYSYIDDIRFPLLFRHENRIGHLRDFTIHELQRILLEINQNPFKKDHVLWRKDKQGIRRCYVIFPILPSEYGDRLKFVNTERDRCKQELEDRRIAEQARIDAEEQVGFAKIRRVLLRKWKVKLKRVDKIIIHDTDELNARNEIIQAAERAGTYVEPKEVPKNPAR